jgi:hypothetical protein
MDATCTDCGAKATCQYDYGTGQRYACAAHDPLRPLISATVRVPGFYQSLPQFPVLATTGHLGVAPPACTCPSAWGGLCPPPACPAHGQAEMYQVRC